MTIADDSNLWTGAAVWVKATSDGFKRSGSVVNTRWIAGESEREVVIFVRGGAITSVVQSQQGRLWDFEPPQPRGAASASFPRTS